MTEGLAELEKEGQIFATDAFKAFPVRRAPDIKFDVKFDNDLLALSIDFSGEYDNDDIKAILSAYTQKKKYVRLKSNDFLAFNEENGLAATAELLESSGMHINDVINSGGLLLPNSARCR